MAGGLPSQVEAAGKRAEELEAKLMASEIPGEQASDTSEGAPTPQEDEADAPNHQPEDESLKKEHETLKHRFDVVQGQHKADVKRFKDELENLKRHNQQLITAQVELTTTIKDLREHLVKDKKPDAEAFNASTALSKEELDHLEAEDLGGKTLEIITKLARAASGSESSKQFEDRLNQVVTKVDQFGQRFEQKTFDDRLTAAIPDFYAVNDEPKFIEWLDSTFRRQSLQEAMSAQDIDRLKQGIDLFKKETGFGRQQQPKESQPRKKKIDDIVEPVQDFVGTPGESGRTYTRAEVSKFYLDQTKGKWRGKEAEAAKIDRDIILATREGRITG